MEVISIKSFARNSPNQKRNLDLALSLRELGTAYGITYGRIARMRECNGFPLLEGIIMPSDFDRWRAEYCRRPRTSEDLPFQSDHTSDE